MRLIDAARFERRLMFTVDRDEICDDCLRNFLNEMAQEPTIDPVKHGRWIEDDDGDGRHCSVCGVDYCDLVTYPENFNFCPMCGAKMDADKTEATT